MEKIPAVPESGDTQKEWGALKAKILSGEIQNSAGTEVTMADFQDALEVARTTRFSNLNFLTRSEGLRSEAACLLISEVENFEELNRLLSHVETLTGNQGKTYSGEELQEQAKNIEGIISAAPDIWELQLQKVTRAYGLRDAVQRCLEERGTTL